MSSSQRRVASYRWVGGWTIGVSLVLVSVLAHFALDAATHAAPWVNNDNALFLFVAQEMEAGATLYRDWHDPAFPSAFMTARLAVQMTHLGISPVLAYDLLLIATGVVGLFVLVHALRHLQRSQLTVLLTASAYLFFLFKSGPVTRDFAQREHFFALLLIPELFAVCSPARLRWRPLWLAALAFHAMNKPHFVAAVVLLEIGAPRDVRSGRKEWLALALGSVAPFGLLWWHSAEAFHALFTETVSMHLSGAYGAMDSSPGMLLRRGPLLVFAATLGALTAITVAVRDNRALRALAIRIALAIAWAVVTVLQQQKYFPYHFTPLFGLAVVGGAWSLAEWLARRDRELVGASLAVLLVLAGAGSIHWDIARNADPLAVRLGRAIEGGDPERIFVASVYSHGICTPFRGAPRCLWPEALSPPLTLMARAPDAAAQLEAWAVERGAWIKHGRPDLLLLSTSELALPRGVTAAGILLDQTRVVDTDEYVPLSPEMQAWVDARGWVVLRRRDVPEASPGQEPGA